MSTAARLAAGATALVLAAALLVGCGPGDDAPRSESEPDVTTGVSGHDHPAEPVRSRPLRDGERRVTLPMPEAYTPEAPYGASGV